VDTALSEGLADWNEPGLSSGDAAQDDSDHSSVASASVEPVKTSDRMKSFYSTLKRKKFT
jgi:hypothetical protein